MIALSIFFSWLLFENWGLWKCVCNKERQNRTGMKPFWAKLCSKLHVHHVTHCLQETGFINVSLLCWLTHFVIISLSYSSVKWLLKRKKGITIVLPSKGCRPCYWKSLVCMVFIKSIHEVLISVTLELCKVEGEYSTSELHVWIWNNLNHRN